MKRISMLVFIFLYINLSIVLAQAPHQQWLKNQLGEQVTLEGSAENRKDGAVLVVTGAQAPPSPGQFESVFYMETIWIDGLPSWPVGDDEWLLVRVTGILTEDYHLPVVSIHQNQDFGTMVQGYGVDDPPDNPQSRHRFVLKNVEWEVLERQSREVYRTDSQGERRR